MKVERSLQTAALAALLTLAIAPSAYAFSAGMVSAFFPSAATGCNNLACHGGGTSPAVQLSGPTSVAPNSTNTYTLSVTNPNTQPYAGLNVSAPAGLFSVGGPDSADTQTMTNPVTSLLELTHSAPKPAVSGVTSFSFDWTAPASFTSVTLAAWGNAVDLSHTGLGDAASAVSLTINNNSLSLCPSTPATCIAPGASLLTMGDVAGKQSLAFTWKKGPTTNPADFGNPTTTARYAMCLYADNTLMDQLDVAAGSGWVLKPHGFNYKNKTSTTLQVVTLAAGKVAGKGQIHAVGKGFALGFGASLPFSGATSVTVQLVNSDNALCWGDVYTGAQLVTNTTTKFKGKH